MFNEDLSAFFNPAEFADAGTLNGQPVATIFDSASVSPSLGGVDMLGAEVTVLIASASVPADVEGGVLVIPQGTYTVRRVEDDAPGLSRLFLELP